MIINKPIYEIRIIEESKDKITGELCCGDDHFETYRKSKTAAFNTAKRLSKKADAFEVVVYEYASYETTPHSMYIESMGDFTHQWYFENGEMSLDMGGNN